MSKIERPKGFRLITDTEIEPLDESDYALLRCLEGSVLVSTTLSSGAKTPPVPMVALNGCLRCVDGVTFEKFDGVGHLAFTPDYLKQVNAEAIICVEAEFPSREQIEAKLLTKPPMSRVDWGLLLLTVGLFAICAVSLAVAFLPRK